jgi:hypothetical protein
MATVDTPRSKTNEKPTAAQPAKAPKRKSRAFRYGALLTVCALCVGGYFAPAIVANTPIGPWAVQSALQLDGSVSLGSTSLGWFSPVVVENLQISDPAGDVLVSVDTLSTDKTLLGLLLDLSDLGPVRVVRPVVHVVALEKDTNLERAFATFLSTPGNSQVAAQLEITEATIRIDDQQSGRQFTIENLALSCALSQANQAVTLTASGTINDDKQPASFKVDLQTQGAADQSAALANGKLDCQCTALPLELLEPLLRRRVEKAQVTGRLSSQLAGAWGEMAQGGEASVSGEIAATGFVFGAAPLGEDRIQLDRIDMPCRIVQQGDIVQIEKLSVDCTLGTLTLTGSAKLSDFSATNRVRELAHENYELKGNLDLARLAAMLPATLRIREGTEITAGQVSLVLGSRQQADSMTWTGRVDASQLEAQERGRRLVWENPLSIEFATHETKDGMVVDSAQCNSNFLQVSAAGSLDDLTASAKFDLAQLVSQLRQFSDLNQLQLSGQGEAQLALKRSAEDQFAAEGTFQAHGFQLVALNHQPWREDNLTARLDAAGQWSQQTLKRLDRAQLAITAGNERLDVATTQPVSDPATTPVPLQCSWRGPLASWAPRLESCLGLGGWGLAGTGSLQATLNCSAKAVEAQQAAGELDQFQLWGHGWFISEKAVTASAAGRFDLERSHADVSEAKLTAGTNGVSLQRASFDRGANGWTADGGAAHVEADLGHLAYWRHDPRTRLAWALSGKLSGDASLKYEAGTMTSQINGTVDQLSLVDQTVAAAPQVVWREQRIAMIGNVKYQTAEERLQVEKVEIASDALSCDASGSLAMATTGGDVDLKGTIQYDWAKLAPIWQPYVGQNVQVVGHQTRQFAVHGHLSGDPLNGDSWRDVTGDASVGWAGMLVNGLSVGPGEVVAQLAGGQIRTQPIDFEVAEGRLTTSPVVRLSPGPAELLVPSGPLLTNVHMTSEMCSRGLKFVAPILSDATVAKGSLSITMDGGRIPLGNPRAGDASGKLALRAQARPGPLAQQFLVVFGELTTILRQGLPSKLTEQSGSLLSVDDSNVEFRLVNGRIYHRGLTFVVGTTPITTHGSVGLDETISMVADVPVQAKLLGIDLSLGTMEGATVQIPIEGTLERPLLDRHFLDQIAGRMLQGATKGVLINGVKTLEKLLPSSP